jgi:hypothetical protein
METNNVTARREVILSALEYRGAMSWTDLREVYYPSKERQDDKANTSFGNQLKKMKGYGLIEKVAKNDKLPHGGYMITAEGSRQLEEVAEHPCARCNTCISADMVYCVGCQEDRRVAYGR